MSNIKMKTYKPEECAVIYTTHARHGGLSNFAHGYPIVVNGKKFKTTEALYQACKFPHFPFIQMAIKDAALPGQAKKISRDNQNKCRSDWNDISIDVMSWCVQLKWLHNQDRFSKLLEETGDKPIVEKSTKCDFWGAKPQPDGTLVGSNVLGSILEEVRYAWKTFSKGIGAVHPPEIANLSLFGEPVGIETYGLF